MMVEVKMKLHQGARKALQKAIPIWNINGYKFATMEDYYEEKSIT